MIIVKRLTGLVMAAVAAITFCSCDKESTESGSASGIVGTWRITHIEYSFNGETVGKETITDGEIYQFRKDGKVELPVEDSDFRVPAAYSYSSKDKTLTLDLFIARAVYSVKKLTSTEMALSLDYSNTSSIFDDEEENVGKAVDSYKGFKIYEYYGDYSYCYRNKGRIIPCEKNYDEDYVEGDFTGDKDGYNDSETTYFKRIK